MTAELVPDSEAQQILANQRLILERLDKQAKGIDECGQLLTWITDNVKGIFEMFGNPQMMAMMGGMAQGMMPNLTGAVDDGRPKD